MKLLQDDETSKHLENSRAIYHANLSKLLMIKKKTLKDTIIAYLFPEELEPVAISNKALARLEVEELSIVYSTFLKSKRTLEDTIEESIFVVSQDLNFHVNYSHTVTEVRLDVECFSRESTNSLRYRVFIDHDNLSCFQRQDLTGDLSPNLLKLYLVLERAQGEQLPQEIAKEIVKYNTRREKEFELTN